MSSFSIPQRPFTWSDARDLGLTRRDIDELMGSRQLIRVLHGVYQPPTLPNTPSVRLEAAGLVIKPHHVLADRLAAWVYGIDTFDYGELLRIPPIETVAPPDGSRQRGKGCTGRRRDLLPGDVTSIDGIAITTPTRTALDLGALLRPRGALAALDGFLRNSDVRREDLIAELPRLWGRRGIVQLRRLVPLADARAESPPESWSRMSIIDADLPVPELQIWVEQTYRVDIGYEGVRVGLEYDGTDDHTTPEQRAHDAYRRRWLEERGWTIIVVRKEDMAPAATEQWIAELRRALRRAT